MSLLSAITIKPGESRVYLRLVFVIYLLTTGLLIYSSLYLIIKCVLIAFIIISLRVDWSKKSPRNGVKEIQFVGNKWVLIMNNGRRKDYNEANVLIHNVLFQLIQFTTQTSQKRLIVLFHDQVTDSQLRLLHLKIAQN